MGSLGNVYFVTLAKGAEATAKTINPNVKVTVADSAYDLGKQGSQMDNFIAAGVDLILLAAADPNAIAPGSSARRRPGSW